MHFKFVFPIIALPDQYFFLSFFVLLLSTSPPRQRTICRAQWGYMKYTGGVWGGGDCSVKQGTEGRGKGWGKGGDGRGKGRGGDKKERLKSVAVGPPAACSNPSPTVSSEHPSSLSYLRPVQIGFCVSPGGCMKGLGPPLPPSPPFHTTHCPPIVFPYTI